MTGRYKLGALRKDKILGVRHELDRRLGAQPIGLDDLDVLAPRRVDEPRAEALGVAVRGDEETAAILLIAPSRHGRAQAGPELGLVLDGEVCKNVARPLLVNGMIIVSLAALVAEMKAQRAAACCFDAPRSGRGDRVGRHEQVLLKRTLRLQLVRREEPRLGDAGVAEDLAQEPMPRVHDDRRVPGRFGEVSAAHDVLVLVLVIRSHGDLTGFTLARIDVRVQKV
mmetsp:Transcript_33044/g.102422  ORF Transcript_33044/g.102422 Transcript_33044/m.102422 type:complete len:225 (-) Transcript_33044:568-1242(-)